jgi:NifU-like protein involved in Fe-S cluster formation
LDDAVLKYYRQLLKTGFRNIGSWEEPSILLNTVGSRTRVCMGARGFMRIYINVKEEVIESVKYMCSCDPTANVAVEIFCDLIKGKTLDVASVITIDMFSQAVEGPSEDLRKSAAGLIEIFHSGIEKYRSASQDNSYTVMDVGR